MSRDHASAEERFRCLYAEHVDPIGFAEMRRSSRCFLDCPQEWLRMNECPFSSNLGHLDRV
ncbi:hypothetical protein [Micromonospora sp. DT47]|uniref:hypothetical protein n=1 Tax=Micromonospora sp. DT47 TaxID=3393431 RepID=UPI003CF766E1